MGFLLLPLLGPCLALLLALAPGLGPMGVGPLLGQQQPWAYGASLPSDGALARSSAALAAFEQQQFEQAEQELRGLIRRYPLLADARAALTALLWQKGQLGEAKSHWAAAVGLDSCYRNSDWLRQGRHWPPRAVAALEQFLAAQDQGLVRGGPQG